MTTASPLADAETPTELPHAAHFDTATEDFSAVAWTNLALSASPQPSIPALLDLLHDNVRNAHTTLDASLKKALSAVPWVVRETDKVRQRANLLRAGVDGVGERVEGVETGVASSVTTIADADTVVRRVQRASELLAQAVEAERLLARLDALLASSAADGSDLVTAADVVSQLRATLAPLRPIPELADRFKQLDAADRKLEALAAPQLQKALEGRNTQAAVNARIVFDHAGRDHAFQTQYVALRGDQVAGLWSSAWEAKAAALTDEDKSVLAGSAGDLAGFGAVATLVAFYGGLYDMVRTEAEWLKEAFPDLRDELLPSLLCEAVGKLKKPVPVTNVFVPSTAHDDVDKANGVSERLFGVALASVKATARISRLCLPDDFPDVDDQVDKEKMNALMTTIVDAMTAIMGPFRAFWSSKGQVCVRQARTAANAINVPSLATKDGTTPSQKSVSEKPTPLLPARRFRPSLGELAKDVEKCTPGALSELDSLLTSLNQKTSGVGISAMKQATNTMASVLSERFLTGLRLPTAKSGSGEDEWARVSGALRLLCATSALKRSWDARKESLYAVAVGTATPVLEVASVVQESPSRRIDQFLAQVQGGNVQEAALVWELVRDHRLTSKVVSEFESLDSAQDFQNLVETVHRIVYDTMFTGVNDRFASFSRRDLWSGSGNDGNISMLGFSSSPLGYATEVADYLMTIPQQLEPFVPDEEDAKYATPRSPYVFSKTGPSSAQGLSNETPDNDADADEDDSANMSFAGMWISLLAIGTMELYVEKICGIPRLSEAGTRQLATDADYICNVIAPLGMSPTREMALVCKLLECKGDGVSFKEAAAGHDSAEERKICRKLAAIRGLSVII